MSHVWPRVNSDFFLTCCHSKLASSTLQNWSYISNIAIFTQTTMLATVMLVWELWYMSFWESLNISLFSRLGARTCLFVTFYSKPQISGKVRDHLGLNRECLQSFCVFTILTAEKETFVLSKTDLITTHEVPFPLGCEQKSGWLYKNAQITYKTKTMCVRELFIIKSKRKKACVLTL